MTQIRFFDRSITPSNDGQDTALPSTESPPSPFVFSASSSTPPQNEFSFRTPSVSVSPTPGADSGDYIFSPSPSPGPLARARARAGSAHSPANDNGTLSDLHDLSLALPDDLSNQTPRTSRPNLTVSGQSPGHEGPSRGSTPKLPPTRYDIAEEDPPEDEFNSAEFQSALRLTKSLTRELADVLSSSPLHQEENSIMHTLHQRASSMADFKPTRTRTVGFVGGAGTGKSSVLNSLLDVEDLVKSGNSGGACTCAATEFHYHESDTLSIQVQLFDEDELLSQQMCLLESYRHFHFAYVLNTNDSDAAERSHFKKRAKLAKDTFYSLFHTRTPCHDTLLHADKGEVECIFRRLIRELRPVSSQTNMTNLTKSACAEKLLELSSAPASAAESATRAAAWPYIEKIKVFLNAQILKKGLVLVDLPGLRDINSARRNITELYVRTCNGIFAVCQAGRAIDDENVQDIFQMAEHLSDINISIICTRSEDIQAKESQKDWPGERADFIGEKLAAIAECEADIEELDEELETLPEKEDRLREDDRKASDLNDRKRRAEKVKRELRFELLRFLVQTRNGDIVTQLSTAYRAANTNTATNVFCVSNTLYSKRRNARLSAALPFLQLSGIIELRRHCISIVSANQHREASVFVKTDVPKLLADIGLWAQSGVDTLDGERRAAVKVVLDNVENRLQSNLFGRRAPTQELSRALCQIFRTEIYDMRLVSQWSTSARAAAYEWRSWHHMTYSAYCRNYGNHSTAKARDRNWNDEAIRHMVRDMTTPWSTVESRLQEEYARVSEFFRDSLDSAIHPLYDDDDDNNPIQWAATLEPLRRAMLLEKFVLLDALENAFEKASLQLKQLKIDGLTSWRTSYTGVYMEGPYNTAMHDSGTGSDGRRKSTITGAFGSEDLFDDIMTKLRAGFGTLAAAAQADVTAAVNAHLAQVGATLDLVRDGNAVIEAQRDLAFHGRVSEALRAGQDKMRDIVGRLEA